jgi:hypothetical protein
VLRHAMRMLNLTPNVLTQARKASKMQLRKNAYRVHRKKNEINGKVGGVICCAIFLLLLCDCVIV